MLVGSSCLKSGSGERDRVVHYTQCPIVNHERVPCGVLLLHPYIIIHLRFTPTIHLQGVVSMKHMLPINLSIHHHISPYTTTMQYYPTCDPDYHVLGGHIAISTKGEASMKYKLPISSDPPPHPANNRVARSCGRPIDVMCLCRPTCLVGGEFHDKSSHKINKRSKLISYKPHN